MKILVVLLFCNLILGGFSSVFRKKQRAIPGHEGQCYDKDNKFYKIGEQMKWTSKICGRKICGEYLGKLYHEIQFCGKVGEVNSLNCRLEANLELPYPDCCERLVCSPPVHNEKFLASSDEKK